MDIKKSFYDFTQNTVNLFISNLELTDEQIDKINKCTIQFFFLLSEVVQFNLLNPPEDNNEHISHSMAKGLSITDFPDYLIGYAKENKPSLLDGENKDVINLDAVCENCIDPYFPFFNALLSVTKNMDIEDIKNNILAVMYKNLLNINFAMANHYIKNGWIVRTDDNSPEGIQKAFITWFEKYYNSLLFTNVITLYNSYHESNPIEDSASDEESDEVVMTEAMETRQQIIEMMRPYNSFITSFANKKAEIINKISGEEFDEGRMRNLINNVASKLLPFTEWVMAESLYWLVDEISFTDAYNKIRMFLNGDDSLEILTAKQMINNDQDLFEKSWIVSSDEEGYQTVDFNPALKITLEGNELSAGDSHRYIIYTYGLPIFSNMLANECASLDYAEFGKDYDDISVDDSLAIKTCNMLTNITCTVIGALTGGIENQEQYNKLSDKVVEIIKSTCFMNNYFKYGDEIIESRLKGTLKGQYINEMKHHGYLPPMHLSEDDGILYNYLSIKKEYSKIDEFGFDANAETIDDYSKTVVLIESHFRNACSSGTGYIVSKDGYVFTCAHVAGELPSGTLEEVERDYRPIDEHYVRICMNITKDINTGAKDYKYKIAKARFVWAYPKYDFAVLKIEGYDNLPHADIDLDPRFSVQTDTSILELGYPYGSWMSSDKEGHKDIMNTHISVNRGTVSTISQTEFAEYDTAEVDLKAHHGNSGSPIINVNTGKVVGWLTGSRFRDNVMGTDSEGRNIYHFDEFNHINLLRNMKGHIEQLIQNIDETGRPVKETNEEAEA